MKAYLAMAEHLRAAHSSPVRRAGRLGVEARRESVSEHGRSTVGGKSTAGAVKRSDNLDQSGRGVTAGATGKVHVNQCGSVWQWKGQRPAVLAHGWLNLRMHEMASRGTFHGP